MKRFGDVHVNEDFYRYCSRPYTVVQYARRATTSEHTHPRDSRTMVALSITPQGNTVATNVAANDVKASLLDELGWFVVLWV